MTSRRRLADVRSSGQDSVAPNVIQYTGNNLDGTAIISSLLARARLRLLITAPLALGKGDDDSSPHRAYIDGTAPGWKELTEDDFTDVNCEPETWTWKNGIIHCTGRPVGVIRTRKPVTNFELVAEWRHLRSAGNSGIFVWAPPQALEGIKPDTAAARRHRGPDPRSRVQGPIRETVG